VQIHIDRIHRGVAVGRNRTGVLEFAVLGLLHRRPMHGYELSKQLNMLLGTFRAVAYGTLYPCLNKLYTEGLIARESDEAVARTTRTNGRAAGRAPGRSKIVYRLTAEGKERLQDLLAESGPNAWDDDEFGVHFAFFGQTRADIRLRILEGRRSRLEDRMEGVRAALARTRERVDSYTLELQRHGLESVEREVRWLNELIASERQSEAGWSSPTGKTSSATDGPYPAVGQTDMERDRESEKESS
jgi:DNA-binding PadR family transcriptional regulator